MKEAIKTIVFVAIAAVLALTALGVHYWTMPKESGEFAKVGEEFYPDFRSGADAQYMEVVAFDDDAGVARKFRVEQKDNLWRIPSHYGYPAEASERLAETTSSVIGIRRQAIAGRRESEHERFGVVDPLSETAKGGESTGRRITIGGTGDEILADYIVGKQVPASEIPVNEQARATRGEEELPPMFYVRAPSEKETYKAELALKVSTKFSDWIQPDLLQLTESDIRELLINKYQIEYKDVERRTPFGVMLMKQAVQSDTETQKLTRDSSFGQWQLEGLKEETEELDSSKVSDITRSLANLEIRGVRPRFRFEGHQLLSPQLELDIPKSTTAPISELQKAVERMQLDLDDKGFALGPSESGKPNEMELVSDRGDMSVATSEGLVYHLYFGKQVIGSEEEIEIGGAVETGSASEEKENKDETDDTKKTSRYLLIGVEFDEERVEGKPLEPVKPVEPAKPDELDAPETGKPTTTPPPSVKPEDLKDKDATESTESPDKKEAESNEDSSAKSSDKGDEPKKTDDSTKDDSSLEERTEDTPDCDAFQEESDSGKSEQEEDKEEDKEEPQETVDSENESSKSNDDEDAAEDEEKDGSDKRSDEKSANDENQSDPKSTDDKDQEKPVGEEPKPTEPDPVAEYVQAMQAYQQQMQRYSIDLDQYKSDLKDYEKKVEEKRKKADGLIERFGSWYYLVPADNLEELRLGRSDLVKAKPEPKDDAKDDATSGIPGLNIGPESSKPPAGIARPETDGKTESPDNNDAKAVGEAKEETSSDSDDGDKIDENKTSDEESTDSSDNEAKPSGATTDDKSDAAEK